MGCEGGVAEPAAGLPNMLVNSPGGRAAISGWAAGGGAPGNPEADGNCGAGAPPGGGDLKNCVNSPAWRGDCGGLADVPAAGVPAPAWNI
jgi:hypothetical protein